MKPHSLATFTTSSVFPSYLENSTCQVKCLKIRFNPTTSPVVHWCRQRPNCKNQPHPHTLMLWIIIKSNKLFSTFLSSLALKNPSDWTVKMKTRSSRTHLKVRERHWQVLYSLLNCALLGLSCLLDILRSGFETGVPPPITRLLARHLESRDQLRTNENLGKFSPL